jgi:hypothetical protein
MKLSAVIVSRNDNYGGNLIERSSYCFNSMIDTFDEVFYIDWNSETKSLLNDVKQNIQFKGNFHHIVIEPKIAKMLTNFDPEAQKCCEVLGRNIGIRRATGDWIVSTNIDIIAPRRKDLEDTINQLDKNTFYTISRRDAELPNIQKFNKDNNFEEYKNWKDVREYLINNSEERHYEEKTMQGDDYSMVNCCGDFQLAPNNIWNNIRGMEEDLIYALYADTNVQKKAVMHGYGLKAIYNPAFFHINHGRGGGGFLTGVNRKANDMYRAIVYQNKTQNKDDWGFSDIDIEYEKL